MRKNHSEVIDMSISISPSFIHNFSDIMPSFSLALAGQLFTLSLHSFHRRYCIPPPAAPGQYFGSTGSLPARCEIGIFSEIIAACIPPQTRSLPIIHCRVWKRVQAVNPWPSWKSCTRKYRWMRKSVRTVEAGGVPARVGNGVRKVVCALRKMRDSATVERGARHRVCAVKSSSARVPVSQSSSCFQQCAHARAVRRVS